MCDSEDLLRAGRRKGWDEMRNLPTPTFMSFSPSCPLKQSKTPHSNGSVLRDSGVLWQRGGDTELSFSCSHEKLSVAPSLPWHRDAYPAFLYYWLFWLCAALCSFLSQNQIRISFNQLCPPTNCSFCLACTKALYVKGIAIWSCFFDSVVFSDLSGYKYDSPLSEEPARSAGSDPVFMVWLLSLTHKWMAYW